MIDDSVKKIGGYVSGNLVTSAICGLAAIVALLVIGVPYAIPLGMWAGVADLIPQVGSYLGAIPAVLVALTKGPGYGIIAVAYFIAYQQFENYVLAPRVYQNSIDLSPAAVVVSTLIGGSLAGFAGALLALPVAVLASFIPMYYLDVTSNIMSLGGLALAIGVLVDASIVMVENAYRHLSEEGISYEEQPRAIRHTLLI